MDAGGVSILEVSKDAENGPAPVPASTHQLCLASRDVLKFTLQTKVLFSLRNLQQAAVVGSSLSLLLLCSAAWVCSLPLWASGGRGAPPCSARCPWHWEQGGKESLSPECGKTASTLACDEVKPTWGDLRRDLADNSSDLELCFFICLTALLDGIYCEKQ